MSHPLRDLAQAVRAEVERVVRETGLPIVEAESYVLRTWLAEFEHRLIHGDAAGTPVGFLKVHGNEGLAPSRSALYLRGALDDHHRGERHVTTTKTTPATFKLNDGTVVIANPETREPLRYVVRAQADARRAKLLAEGIAAEVIQPGFGRVFYLRHGLDFDLTDDGTQDEIDDEIDEMEQACDKAGLVFDEDYTVLYGAAWAITGVRAFTARAVAVIEEA